MKSQPVPPWEPSESSVFRRRAQAITSNVPNVASKMKTKNPLLISPVKRTWVTLVLVEVWSKTNETTKLMEDLRRVIRNVTIDCTSVEFWSKREQKIEGEKHQENWSQKRLLFFFFFFLLSNFLGINACMVMGGWT